jgi:hypothetical protein
MHSIHAAVLSAALLGSASVAFTQAPAAATSPAAKHYTKSRSFDLPVKMDQEFRLTLKEIRLYVKTPNGDWALQESGSPYHERFTCKAPQDGEYWYTLATVDRAGRMTPADLNADAPSQKVVVDATPPTIQVQAAPTAAGELSLRCTVTDLNPDLATLRAVCRTDIGDIPLEMAPNEPGVFRVKGAEMLRHPVIVTVKDRAGNEGMQLVNLRDLIGSTLTPGPAPAKAPTEISQVVNRPESKDPPAVGVNPLLNKVETPTLPPSNRVEFPASPPSSSRVEFPAPPPPLNPLPPNLPPIHGAEAPVKTPASVPELPSKSPSAPHQLINTTQASIEYRIDHVGPSGVGKVEIYMTPDNGQTWHRLAEDTIKRSPAEIKLPGDGVYGIRIIVSNGNGFGGKAPIRGDAPHCTVEVDTSAPFVQLRSAEVLPGPGVSQVEIRWNAKDKNLGAEPVTLHYRTRPDGPWEVIARNLKNDGAYRWAFPRDVGSEFFFKIEVADQAGNVSHDASRQAISIDMTEPRATIVGVTGGGAMLPR